MLTANAAYTLRTGTKTQLTTSATVYVRCMFDKTENQYKADVSARFQGTQVDGASFSYTQSELTAYTSSGANDVLKAFNLVEQAVKASLEALAENSGVTFTIS